MRWPWNVRVTEIRLSLEAQQSAEADDGLVPPDYYHAQYRECGRWLDAGTAHTWLEAFLMGLVS
jgi:hypothetical protein